MTLIRIGIGGLLALLLFLGGGAIATWHTNLATAAQPSRAGILARLPAQLSAVSVDQLPPEAKNTLTLIKSGGPFPYAKDGTVFGNFEKRLPVHPKGYYHEYTVPTPKIRNRGAQRMITGQGGEIYYTKDHYRTFVRVKL